MAFNLEFSPEFFLAEGEPYDAPLVWTDKPKSVWSAIVNIPPARVGQHVPSRVRPGPRARDTRDGA